MGGFESFFGRIFGTRRADPFGRSWARPSGARARHGADIETPIEIELDEAYHGARKRVTITRTDPCANCNGRGFEVESEPQPCPKCSGRGHLIHIHITGRGRSERAKPCDRCHGDGVLPGAPCPVCDADGHVQQRVTLDVDAPAGIESGQTVRVAGEGDLGKPGGDRGDAVVEIDVAEHPRFARRHDDLFTAQPLSFPQAVFGATVEIPTLDRSVAMTVPPGTQSGETFRLRGKGMPQLERPGRGDLFVRMQLVTPAELSPEQQEAIRAFGEAGDFDPDDERDQSERLGD